VYSDISIPQYWQKTACHSAQTMSANDAVDGSSTGIAMFKCVVLQMTVVGTKQSFSDHN